MTVGIRGSVCDLVELAAGFVQGLLEEHESGGDFGAGGLRIGGAGIINAGQQGDGAVEAERKRIDHIGLPSCYYASYQRP